MLNDHRLTRRRVLRLASAVAATLRERAMAHAQTNPNAGLYFPPAGRIGVMKPADIDAWSNRWTLLSKPGDDIF